MFKILIVDDDKNIRYVMKEILEANGYVAISAKDGAEALEILASEHVDMAVVDIMMPHVDGYELTRQIREFSPDFPILMVSAKQLPDDRKRGFLAGIDKGYDYALKLGVASGGATAFSKSLATKEEIDKLFENIETI